MDMVWRRIRNSLKRLPKCRGLPASYTVEASYVMTIVLLSLSFLIRTAYARCEETAGVMRLHHTVEFLRCQEDGEQTEQRSFSFQNAGGTASRQGGRIYGAAEGEAWQKEIQSDIFAPEDMMRMLTIFDHVAEGEKNNGGIQGTGSSVSERAAAELSDDRR